MRFFCILFFIPILSFAQKLPVVKADGRVSLLKKDTLYQFYAEQPPTKKFKVNTARFYYWFTQDTILITQGSFNNRLLHKTFQAFYPNHNLYQEGQFEYGLKEGIWKIWYPNGQLKTVSHWKKGLLKGSFTEYSAAGNKVKEGVYKDGLLSGTVATYLPDGKVIETQYEKGRQVVPVIPAPVHHPDSTSRAPKANQ